MKRKVESFENKAPILYQLLSDAIVIAIGPNILAKGDAATVSRVQVASSVRSAGFTEIMYYNCVFFTFIKSKVSKVLYCIKYKRHQ